MFYFQILSIQAGWFNVKISNESKEAFVTNSWYLGNDAPQVLLKNLNSLAMSELSTCWLCWHDEPGAYVWHLSKERETLRYKIADAAKQSYQLGYEGIELEKEPLSGEIITGHTSFFQILSKAWASILVEVN